MEAFPKTVPIGASFGVVTVVAEGHSVEVATYRSDGQYADGRHPNIVFYSDSAKEDVSRRDFTVNGMLLSTDPASQFADGFKAFVPVQDEATPGYVPCAAVVDHVGGMRDIALRLIRCIGFPNERFREDALRMLRACRFAAQLGFDVEPTTMAAITENAESIGKVSAERVRDELLKLVSAEHPDRGLDALMLSGLAHHLPVRRVLLGLAFVRFAAFKAEGKPLLGMAMLLADSDPVGIGPLLAFDLKMPKADVDHVVGALAVRAVLRGTPGQFAGELASGKVARLKRLMRNAGARDAITLVEQDHALLKDVPDAVLPVLEYLKGLPPEEIRPARLLTGEDLIRLGLQPGPVFREILEDAEDAQLDGEVKTKGEALERFALKHVKAAMYEAIGHLLFDPRSTRINEQGPIAADCGCVYEDGRMNTLVSACKEHADPDPVKNIVLDARGSNKLEVEINELEQAKQRAFDRQDGKYVPRERESEREFGLEAEK